jgi:uncharacterized protein (TIGR02145 family)
VNIADTAGMLMPYLRKLDTASVSDRINLKVNIADTAGMLTPYLRKLDTTSVSNRINLKVNIADTAGMLTPYLRKLDTASVSNRINLKVNIADTSGMLTPYLRKLDTASVSDRINLKVNIADTAGMLMPYLRKLDTASLSNRINLKVNITDTAVMLTPYLRKLDTASLSNRINNAGLPTTGNSTGNMLYWNGSAWVRITPGSVGQILKVSAGGIPVWGNADFYCGLTTLSDIDNNTYNTVQIGSQCWMSENLRVRKYRDGTNIPFDNSGGLSGDASDTWGSGFEHTIYAHDSVGSASKLKIYGVLYYWYVVSPNYGRNLCPTGWHVPTDAEWTTLTDFLGGESVAGGKMKETGTTYWISESAGTDNSSGFSALGGGYRDSDGRFINITYQAVFWSATEFGSDALYRRLDHNYNIVIRNNFSKYVGASVRCLKD